MTGAGRGGAASWMPLYYTAGTLVFWAIDIVLSAPIRAAFLGRSGLRWGYYGALLLIGVAGRQWPRTALPLALLEGSVNLVLLVLSIMLPVWGVLDQIESHQPLSLGFTPWTFVNVALTGGALIYFLRRNVDRLGGPLARRLD